MSKNVVILGAKGRIGRNALEAFHEAGWNVTAFARNWENEDQISGVNYLIGDALNSKQLLNACESQQVIVNAINPAYKDWSAQVPVITRNVIAAGIQNAATVMIPGNIYNYGNRLPPVLNEMTPHVPNIKKGKIRIDMERAYEEAAASGLKTIVLRAGDYLEGRDTGNWFETYIANKIKQGKITYPGLMDVDHAWAYIPDVARAMVGLAEQRNNFDGFEEFVFDGFTLSGTQLVRKLERIAGKKLKVLNFPWMLVRLLAIFSAQMREVIEMRYLWNKPHSIDGSKLNAVLSDFTPTPLETVLRKVLH